MSNWVLNHGLSALVIVRRIFGILGSVFFIDRRSAENRVIIVIFFAYRWCGWESTSSYLSITFTFTNIIQNFTTQDKLLE